MVPGLSMGTLGTAVLPASAATLYAVAGDRGAVGGLPGQLDPALLLDSTQVFEPPLGGRVLVVILRDVFDPQLVGAPLVRLAARRDVIGAIVMGVKRHPEQVMGV